MVNVSNNFLIEMVHGDYLKLPLFINAGDEIEPLRYILQKTVETSEGVVSDKVYFSIEEPNQPFEQGIVRKVYDADDLNTFGDVVIKLDSSDTENLVPGQYFYEIKLAIERDDGTYIDTIVPQRKFYIL